MWSGAVSRFNLDKSSNSSSRAENLVAVPGGLRRMIWRIGIDGWDACMHESRKV